MNGSLILHDQADGKAEFSGSLEVLDPSMVIQITHLGALTGMIKFVTPQDAASVYFTKGELTYAAIDTDRKKKIGEQLIEKGLITREQLEGALQAYRHEKGHARVGQILIERGYLTRETLEAQILEQMFNVVCRVLTWNAGHFFFFRHVQPRNEEVLLNVKLDHLILEATRRNDENSR